MSNNEPNANKLAPPPSVNYSISKNNLVYRLSELVFGSLLAAYILGFGSFAIAALSGSDTSFLPVTLRILTLVAISTTFAYLTAAFYMRYNTGILTMPTASVERSQIDFSIALVQAVAFSFSMLLPWLFPLLIVVVLSLAAWRQNLEFNALTDYYLSRLWHPASLASKLTVELEKTQQKSFRKSIRTTVKDSDFLGWSPVTTQIKWKLLSLSVFGVLLSLAHFLSLEFLEDWLRFMYPVVSIGVCIGVFLSAMQTMVTGSHFIISSDNKLWETVDQRYWELEKKLKALSAVNL